MTTIPSYRKKSLAVELAFVTFAAFVSSVPLVVKTAEAAPLKTEAAVYVSSNNLPLCGSAETVGKMSACRWY